MPKKYTVEIHRTVTVKPESSDGGGWIVFALAFVVAGIAAVADKPAPSPHQFQNPLGTAPAGDDVPLPDNPFDQLPPDTATPDIAPQPVAKPGRVVTDTKPGRIVARFDGDSCRVDAFANGEKFDFLIDTGSSAIWFDGPAQARRLGVNPAKLTYETFDGGGRAASVRLREFRIGGFAVNDVPAYIDKGGTVYGGGGPLLGMSVLKNLRLEVANGGCVLMLPQSASSLPAYKPGDRADMERLISNAR